MCLTESLRFLIFKNQVLHIPSPLIRLALLTLASWSCRLSCHFSGCLQPLFSKPCLRRPRNASPRSPAAWTWTLPCGGHDHWVRCYGLTYPLDQLMLSRSLLLPPVRMVTAGITVLRHHLSKLEDGALTPHMIQSKTKIPFWRSAETVGSCQFPRNSRMLSHNPKAIDVEIKHRLFSKTWRKR